MSDDVINITSINKKWRYNCYFINNKIIVKESWINIDIFKYRKKVCHKRQLSCQKVKSKKREKAMIEGESPYGFSISSKYNFGKL